MIQMNKKFSLVFFLSLLSVTTFASDPAITLTIDSLVNVRGNGSLEACGKAVHQDGKKPLLVTLKHDQSFYTTLTAQNDVWCVVFKRWTMDGKISVVASDLGGGSASSSVMIQLSE